MKISELVVALNDFKSEQGDVEVFMENQSEKCFDGVAKIIGIAYVSEGKNYVGIVRNDDVLNP